MKTVALRGYLYKRNAPRLLGSRRRMRALKKVFTFLGRRLGLTRIIIMKCTRMTSKMSRTAEVVKETCRACGEACEMTLCDLYEVMFGSFESFRYQLCSSCGTMQIGRIPSDLSRHYPDNYYSLGGPTGSDFVRWVRSKGLRYSAGKWTMVGHLLCLLGRLPSDALWLRACKPRMNSRILDVGCGRGDRLRELALAGFTCLKGVDPFVPANTEAAPGVPVLRGNLSSLSEEFDLIMMHHSLEHVDAPGKTIADAAKLLAEDGLILIRVPVMGKWAWRTYGVDWVQLDAPRHLNQFTEKGVKALAESNGLKVSSIIYDSFEFQFSGSEKVRNRRVGNKQAIQFTKRQIRDFARRADALNRESDGDQACFVLSRGA